MKAIVEDFTKIPVKNVSKTKVGVVGEIYVKYSSMANNDLENFLVDQDCEVMVPGVMGFMMFKIDNRIEDINLYGGNPAKKKVCQLLMVASYSGDVGIGRERIWKYHLCTAIWVSAKSYCRKGYDP